MEKYVDGFVIPIAKENVGKYKEMAQKAGELWMEHGALEFCECAGDDLEIENMLSFKQTAEASEEETVIFSWIVFKSREHRDRVNHTVMEDARMKDMMKNSEFKTFNYKRIAYGGFKTLVTL